MLLIQAEPSATGPAPGLLLQMVQSTGERVGKSFPCIGSRAVVTRWQQRGAEKPLLAAIWQPELGEPGWR